ncbi:GerW family sporulation protein [Gracilibacillus dipsosauri]|uniref:Sporulation protein YtfJ n=1 Tax=Gracilibacillus dipsosauri TaxID=178340 RepID=A0A317L320_9BACI|nr:GerW family sporulation protein [Gracilibacillus dipsosauri]PWU70217.1 sporulation protein YtfJ [Gracilibacillus dipsosauri]
MEENNVHPLEGFMSLTMDNLKQMIEVDTAIGKPIDTPDGSLIIPLSKVKFGFAAGGSEFNGKGQSSDKQSDSESESEAIIPFGGGSGGGVSITPSAFLVANKQGVELVTLHESTTTRVYEKVMDKGPELVDQIMEMLKKNKDDKDNHEERKRR